jgi:carbon-monoxide dehydrogenase medium subunit/xanthine dehydrogenase FAD-binding subunit
MQQFEFHSAASIEEVAELLAAKGSGCKVIAGGTDLIPSLRNGDLHPDLVLNLLEIHPLRGIREREDSVWVGPLTTFTEMVESEALGRCFPLLVQAAATVGGPQIRNRGTIGGNIANASPAADVLPAVLTLDAKLTLYSRASGERTIPLSEAIDTPNRVNFRPNEFLTGIILQKLHAGTRSAFEKLGRRNAMARARMNLSLVLRQDSSGRVLELRIVPGAVMPVVKRMRKAEETLLGEKPDEKGIEEASTRLIEEMVEITGRRWSTEYKVPVMRNIFKRMFKSLIG